jgi:hypothetical protein
MHRTGSRSILVALALAAGASAPAAAQSMSNDKAMADKGMTSDGMMMGTKGGTFTGAQGHSASGSVTLTGTGKDRKLEFSDTFKADKAPDTWVILTRDGMVDGPGSLELGKLRKDAGAQSYAIPGSADLASYSSVVLWSKGHKMAVAQAPLAAGAMDHGSMGSMDHGSMGTMSKDTGMMKPMAKDSGMMKKP